MFTHLRGLVVRKMCFYFTFLNGNIFLVRTIAILKFELHQTLESVTQIYFDPHNSCLTCLANIKQ